MLFKTFLRKKYFIKKFKKQYYKTIKVINEGSSFIRDDFFPDSESVEIFFIPEIQTSTAHNLILNYFLDKYLFKLF
jgi:hypothetical protein